jgi:plastocyanin
LVTLRAATVEPASARDRDIPRTEVDILKIDRADRVRLIAATAVTLVALPLLMNENRNETEQRPPAVAAVGPAADLAIGTRTTETTEPGVPEGIATGQGYLGGSTTVVSNRTIDIAVKAPKQRPTADGKAVFKRWAPWSTGVANPCATPLVKVGTTVTVTNLDNGHTTTCVNVSREGSADGVIVLDTTVFEQIADLVQAPIPVQLSW